MRTRLTTPYRARLADALTGAALPGALTPARARLGNGAAGRDPGDAMYAPTLDASLGLSRSANHEVVAVVTLPAAQASTTYDEVGIFAADGTLLLHATFAQQPLSPGVEAGFEFTFNPEVYSG